MDTHTPSVCPRTSHATLFTSSSTEFRWRERANLLEYRRWACRLAFETDILFCFPCAYQRIFFSNFYCVKPRWNFSPKKPVETFPTYKSTTIRIADHAVGTSVRFTRMTTVLIGNDRGQLVVDGPDYNVSVSTCPLEYREISRGPTQYGIKYVYSAQKHTRLTGWYTRVSVAPCLCVRHIIIMRPFACTCKYYIASRSVSSPYAFHRVCLRDVPSTTSSTYFVRRSSYNTWKWAVAKRV